MKYINAIRKVLRNVILQILCHIHHRNKQNTIADLEVHFNDIYWLHYNKYYLGFRTGYTKEYSKKYESNYSTDTLAYIF
jgi:hypothetical protein